MAEESATWLSGMTLEFPCLSVFSVFASYLGREGVMNIWSWIQEFEMHALARGDAETYLAAKLALAGRPGLTFTPPAITRLRLV